MGYRLHAFKTYKVEYTEGFFNYNYSEFMKFIRDSIDTIYTDDNEMEIDKEELSALIKDMKDNPDKYKGNFEIFDYYSVEEVANNLSYYLDNADEEHDFVKLIWL